MKLFSSGAKRSMGVDGQVFGIERVFGYQCHLRGHAVAVEEGSDG